MTELLVLRALGLGDLLASVAGLRGLRRAWPDARLTLAGPARLGGWLRSLGAVDAVLPVADLEHAAVALRSRADAVSVAVNLHGSGPESHRLLERLGAPRVVAYSCAEAGHVDGPSWRADEHEVDRWIRLSQWAGGAASADDLRLPSPGERSDHVVVHPGAASGSRRWPADRWAAVAGALAASGRRVVVTGTASERLLCGQVAAGGSSVEDLCGRLELAELGRVVGTAALALSGDTGVSHVATAFGTPSVTLFGPVSPALWGPRADPHLHRVLWHGEPAELRPGDPHGTRLDERLAMISVDEVLSAAEEVCAVAAG